MMTRLTSCWSTPPTEYIQVLLLNFPLQFLRLHFMLKELTRGVFHSFLSWPITLTKYTWVKEVRRSAKEPLEPSFVQHLLMEETLQSNYWRETLTSSSWMRFKSWRTSFTKTSFNSLQSPLMVLPCVSSLLTCQEDLSTHSCLNMEVTSLGDYDYQSWLGLREAWVTCTPFSIIQSSIETLKVTTFF